MGHYYDKDGNPAYHIDGKPTGIREARKNKLYPSVTEIIAMKSNYGLQIYRENQILEACLRTPAPQLPMIDEDIKKWRKQVLAASDEHRNNAAQRGTEIHDKLEGAILGHGLPQKDRDICDAALEFLNEKFPNANWVPEQSFVNTIYGFGGKVDLHDPDNLIVLDFKTKGTSDIKKMRQYDDHGMQTAAYAVGLFDAEYLDLDTFKRYNLFISTEEAGVLKLCESKDFARDWGMFRSLNHFWQLKNKYDPTWRVEDG